MRRRASRAALLATVFAGCATPPATVLPEPQPPIARKDVSPRALLARLEERYDETRTFRSIAELQSVSPRGREHVREVIVIERPASLRIDLLGPFGVALQVTSDRTRLDAYHRGDRTHYRGEPSVDNLARFTRLPLEMDDLVDVLLGLPPHRMPREPQLLELEPLARRWRLHTTVNGGSAQILWFDETDQLPVRAEEYDQRGSLLYVVAFRDYRSTGDLLMPHEVEIRVPALETSLGMTYTEPSVNETLPEGIFSIEPPDGSRNVELESKEAVSQK